MQKQQKQYFLFQQQSQHQKMLIQTYQAMTFAQQKQPTQIPNIISSYSNTNRKSNQFSNSFHGSGDGLHMLPSNCKTQEQTQKIPIMTNNIQMQFSSTIHKDNQGYANGDEPIKNFWQIFGRSTFLK
jgi:hypothetical protein